MRPGYASLNAGSVSAQCHAGGIKLSTVGALGKGPANRGFWVANRLSPTTYRTTVLKWEKSSDQLSKLLAITSLSIYFFEEKSFVAFSTLSHCSETEKPLTPVKVPAYSGVWW
jgi:hypothetical protein